MLRRAFSDRFLHWACSGLRTVRRVLTRARAFSMLFQWGFWGTVRRMWTESGDPIGMAWGAVSIL